jgi:hypothetical protein
MSVVVGWAKGDKFLALLNSVEPRTECRKVDIFGQISPQRKSGMITLVYLTRLMSSTKKRSSFITI